MFLPSSLIELCPCKKLFFQHESGCGFFLAFAKRIRKKKEIFNLMFSFLKHSINFHSPFFLQQHQLYLHRLNSSERFQEIPLDVGAIMEDSGRREHTEMFYSFASFLVPSKIFRYGFTTNSSEVNICEFANVSSLELFFTPFRNSSLFLLENKGNHFVSVRAVTSTSSTVHQLLLSRKSGSDFFYLRHNDRRCGEPCRRVGTHLRKQT